MVDAPPHIVKQALHDLQPHVLTLRQAGWPIEAFVDWDKADKAYIVSFTIKLPTEGEMAIPVEARSNPFRVQARAACPDYHVSLRYTPRVAGDTYLSNRDTGDESKTQQREST